jgi:hypothetical protein
MVILNQEDEGDGKSNKTKKKNFKKKNQIIF